VATCYLDGVYTAKWCDVNEIISTCKPIVSPEVLSQMERILTTGCPSYFNWEEDSANKRAFVSRRNLPSVAQHSNLVMKTLAKEVRNSHLIPMAWWVCTCSPWGRHVPQNIQIKPGKKPRLTCDANGTGDGDHIWHCFHRSVHMDLESPDLLPRQGHILGIFGHFILLLLPQDLS